MHFLLITANNVSSLKTIIVIFSVDLVLSQHHKPYATAVLNNEIRLPNNDASLQIARFDYFKTASNGVRSL